MFMGLPELSTYAGQIDRVIIIVAILTGFWFLAAEGMFFWLIWRFRAKPGVKSEYLEGHEHHVERWISWPHRIILVWPSLMAVLKLHSKTS